MTKNEFRQEVRKIAQGVRNRFDLERDDPMTAEAMDLVKVNVRALVMETLKIGEIENPDPKNVVISTNDHGVCADFK